MPTSCDPRTSRPALPRWGGSLILALLAWCLLVRAATSHPLSHGTLAVVVYPERVEVRLRTTVEEAVITGMLAGPSDLDDGSRPAWHAQYLLEHLEVAIDGQRWHGRIGAIFPPGRQAPGVTLPDPAEHLVYDLVYTPPQSTASAALPQQLALSQNVLVGVELAPGVSWEASYTASIRTAASASTDGLLLSTRAALTYACTWETTPSTPAATVARGALLRDYVVHGFHHILVGYDHLLFICALVLAVRGLWDLVKIVTAFTLAHTLTLSLAALGLVQVPAGLVEPMIALSIVVVAAQNLFWPRHARGWTRLAIATGFGLFHGLGFAGGLLDVMQAMSGFTIVLAIAAFSVGVEFGHQLIVVPLYSLLTLAARARTDPAFRTGFALRVQRWGSALIGLAGLYYLGVALHAAFAVAGA